MTPKSVIVAKTLGRSAPLVLIPLVLGAAASPAFAKGGGWIEGWGSATIVSAVQPGTSDPCDASHACQLTIEGRGDTKASFGVGAEVGQFELQAALTVNLAQGTPNGFGQQCFPVTGALSLRRGEPNARFGLLVADIQGQECGFGASTTLSALAATYVVDASQSTGKYAEVSGTGAVRAAIDTSRSPAAVGFSFSGSLGGARK